MKARCENPKKSDKCTPPKIPKQAGFRSEAVSKALSRSEGHCASFPFPHSRNRFMILRLRLLKKKVNSNKTSVQRPPELTRKVQELDDLRHTVEKLQKTLDAIPPEIKDAFRKTDNRGKNTICHA